jgi:hypothetical protein
MVLYLTSLYFVRIHCFSEIQVFYRTVLSPTAIVEITENGIITPSLSLLDRQWKSEIIRSTEFLEEVNEKVAIHVMRDAVVSTLEILKLENKKSSTMNVRTVCFFHNFLNLNI